MLPKKNPFEGLFDTPANSGGTSVPKDDENKFQTNQQQIKEDNFNTSRQQMKKSDNPFEDLFKPPEPVKPETRIKFATGGEQFVNQSEKMDYKNEPAKNKNIEIPATKSWEDMNILDKLKETIASLPEGMGEVRNKIEKIISEAPPILTVKPAHAPSNEQGLETSQEGFDDSLYGSLSRTENIVKGRAVSGLTGGVLKPETEVPRNQAEAIFGDLSEIAGSVYTINKIGAKFSSLALGNETIAQAVTKYPTVSKYLFPLAKNAAAFDIYGQLDPDINDRFKKLAYDTVISVPYTGLGFIKQAKYSIPASFGLGFGLAKLDGASDEDAYIQGGILSVLDAWGRFGSKGEHFVAGRTSDRILKNEAANVINRYSDIEITSKSSPEEIQNAYRSAVKKTHPDVAGGSDLEFKKVNNAYKYLSGKETIFERSEDPEKPANQKAPKRIEPTKEQIEQKLNELQPEEGASKKTTAITDPKPSQIRERLNALSDIIANGEGPERDAAIKEDNFLREKINKYSAHMEEVVLSVPRKNNVNDLAQIKVLNFDDSKWVYSIDASTNMGGVYTGFFYDDLLDSKEEASKKAAKHILEWANNELKNARNKTEKNELNKIIKSVNEFIKKPVLDKSEIERVQEEIQKEEEKTRQEKEKSMKYMADNYDQAKNDYIEVIKKKYGSDNVVSADHAKEAIPGYNGTNSDEYQTAASKFAARYFDDLLQSRKGKENNTLLIYGGGTGAGKTSSLKALGEETSGYAIVYDTNASSMVSASQKIDKALDNGYKVRVLYVLRDPVDAYERGVIPRMREEGRVVTIQNHIKEHKGSYEVIPQLIEKYGDKIELAIVDNTGEHGKAKLVTFDKMPKFDYSNIRAIKKNIYDKLKEASQRGDITRDQFQKATIERPLGAAVRQQSEQEHERGLGEAKQQEVEKQSTDKADKPSRDKEGFFDTRTQKEIVKEAVKEGPMSIKEIAKETEILEPNVRRILGVGAKDGTFERVDKGVYILRKSGNDIAYVETGDAVEVLPRLAEEGMRADMVFLDIPYKTPSVTGGNRGAKFEFITVEQFGVVISAIKQIARDQDTPVFYMFSQAPSGIKEMNKYTAKMTDAGFKPVARGEYTKLQKDGVTRTRNMRGVPDYPEGIILFTQSGKFDKENPDLNFKLVRPRGYQTEKPAELAKKLVEMSTAEGEIVLDPFAGSGVIPAEAVKAGRRAVAIEKSSKAIEEYIKPRIEKAITEIHENEKKLSEAYKSYPKAEEEMGNIWQELFTSEAGERFPIMDSDGYITDWTGKPSSFPQWIPEKLRSKKLFDKVMGGLMDINNIKYPDKNKFKQRELYDIILNDLDGRLGTDTSTLRDKIIQNYEQIYKRGNTKKGSGSAGRGEGDRGEKRGEVKLSADLYQEARKYKSAEEFVKAQGTPVYHGTRQPLRDGKGLFSLTKDKSTAENYSQAVGGSRTGAKNIPKLEGANLYDDFWKFNKEKNIFEFNGKTKTRSEMQELANRSEASAVFKGARVDEYFVDPNVKVLDLTSKSGVDEILSLSSKGDKGAKKILSNTRINNTFDWGATKSPEQLKAFNEILLPQLEAKGFGGINYFDDIGKTIAVFDTKSIKTNSQLTDIWNEANKKSRGSGGAGYASKSGDKKTSELIENKAGDKAQEIPQGFKISGEAKKIINEFGAAGSEKTISKKYLGLYKPLSDRVRVQALYNVTVVVHEVTHAIDLKNGISKKIIFETKRGSSIKKTLTDIYEELYPTGKRTHKLEKRIVEGVATFIENYFYNPSGISEKYPMLVNELLKPSGKFYHKDFTRLLERMNGLVDSYARLSPEDRIASRIRTGKEIVEEKTGFSKAQKLIFEFFDRFEPLRRYSKQLGVQNTWSDPTVQAFNILNKNTIVYNWVKGDFAPVLHADGNYTFEKGTVETYEKLIDGKAKEFSAYLVARRVVENNNKLSALINESKVGEGSPKRLFEKTHKKRDLVNEINHLEEVIKNDDFNLQDATAVVVKYKDQFREATEVYDVINKRLINYSVDMGLLDPKVAEKYLSEEGYTSFKRYIDDELSGSLGTMKTSSRSKVSSFKQRTGSELDIIDPVYNQIMAIGEVIGKGLENLLWQKVYKLSLQSSEVGQRFEEIEPMPAVDGKGKISFPQERDPNIIRIFINGKRKFIKAAPEFLAVAKTLRPGEVDGFVKLLRIPSSIFSRLTTSANPLFALGNLTVDQFTALAQTKAGYNPVSGVVGGLHDFIIKSDELTKYMTMGGKRQTMASYYDLSPEDVTKKLTGKSSKTDKIVNVIDSGISILELPSNLSEIITRFGEYKKAIEQGKTHSEAMYLATDVTTPFQLQGNLYGRLGREYVKSIPYLNAIIQVMYKFSRTLKDNPKRLTAVYAGLLLSSLASLLILYKMANDKQRRQLNEMPARELSRAIFIPSPTGDGWIRIRIPEQAGSITGPVTLYIVQNYYGKNEAKFNEYVEASTAFLPDALNITAPDKMILSLIPQALKPSVEVVSNTKTYPEILPIVPDYMKDMPASERYTAYTSKVAIYIGKMFNVSPMQVEFWTQEQLGAVGKMFLGKMPSFPLYRQEKEYVMAGRSYNNFYVQRDAITIQYNQLKSDNTFSKQEKENIKELYETYNNMADTLSDMRKVTKDDFELSEDIKTEAYNLLLDIDKNSYNESVDRDLNKRIYQLDRKVIRFAKDSGASNELMKSLNK